MYLPISDHVGRVKDISRAGTCHRQVNLALYSRRGDYMMMLFIHGASAKCNFQLYI